MCGEGGGVATGGDVAATLGVATGFAAAGSKLKKRRHAESIAPAVIVAIRGGLIMHSRSCPARQSLFRSD